MQYSRGRSKTDAYPIQKSTASWEEFAEALLSESGRSIEKGCAYICAPFKANGTGKHHRCAEDALPRDWIALDCDGSTPDSFAALCMRLAAYLGVGWMTSSSTPECPRFRVVLALERSVDRGEGMRLGAVLETELSARLTGVKWDKSQPRAEQPAYLPLRGALSMRWSGEVVEVTIPPGNGAQAPGTRSRGERIQSEDPVVKLLTVLKNLGGGKLAIVCPFAASHSSTTSESSTVYMLAHFGGVPVGVFHCLHESCAGRSQGEFLAAVGVNITMDAGAHWAPVVEKAEEPSDARPFIGIIKAQTYHEKVAEVESALIGADANLYQRGGVLVCVKTVPTGTVKGVVRKDVHEAISSINAICLQRIMSNHLRFRRRDMRAIDMETGERGAWVEVAPPRDLADSFFNAPFGWRLPVMVAVMECPTLRPDGTLLQVAGFDAATGIFMSKHPPVSVPEFPSKEDAEAALRVLEKSVETFPFDSEADKSVWLAAALTGVVRRSILLAPMFAFTAPQRGGGKTKSANMIGIIATGRLPALINNPSTEDELEKRLVASLIAGDPVVNIDNVEKPMSSSLLCSALTTHEVSPRVLGSSINVRCVTSTVVLTTGNNWQCQGDLVRRVLLCRIDPHHESPETREFAFDPETRTLETRMELVAAALTVLKAYWVAGRPKQEMTPFGSFEEWSLWVRAPLVWLGRADPYQEKSRPEDDDGDDAAAVFAAWGEVFLGQELTCKAVAAGACALNEHGEVIDQGFRDALLNVAEDPRKPGSVSNKRLGEWLKHREGRVCSGKTLTRTDTGKGHEQKWKISVRRL